jgi:hypothetical protein
MEVINGLNKRYFTQQEAADLFRVTPATVKNWREAGLLEYFQPPGSTRVLYPREAVVEFERIHTKKAKVIEFKKPAEIEREMPGISSKRNREWRV